MIRRTGFLILAIYLFLPAAYSPGVERFPPPDFETGYKLPLTTVPQPRADIYEYLDVAVLLAALSIGSYLVLKKRSRRYIFILMIFSLAYFGFWREGCVCSIGAIQNVTLSLFDSRYVLPITVIAFFLLPLFFTLFFGRIFCAAVCPLGAIQDLFLLRPLKLPRWLEHGLGLLAYLYLGAAVLFAATGSAFIICQYDPFVSFFRRSGSLNIFILGFSFLIISLFVGRPYCRFLCPYGVLLRLLSRVSKYHATITPDECIECRLCEDACPFNAIEKPYQPPASQKRTEGKTTLLMLLLLLPVLTILTGWLTSHLSSSFSRMHATVRLADRIWLEETGQVQDTIDESDAFRTTGQTVEELYQQSMDLQQTFYRGCWMLGAFAGLVLGLKLIQLSVRRHRTEYQTNRMTCLSCGRCFQYCPREQVRLKERNKTPSS
jgi:polyferredoxin